MRFDSPSRFYYCSSVTSWVIRHVLPTKASLQSKQRLGQREPIGEKGYSGLHDPYTFRSRPTFALVTSSSAISPAHALWNGLDVPRKGEKNEGRTIRRQIEWNERWNWSAAVLAVIARRESIWRAAFMSRRRWMIESQESEAQSEIVIFRCWNIQPGLPLRLSPVSKTLIRVVHVTFIIVLITLIRCRRNRRCFFIKKSIYFEKFHYFEEHYTI